MQATQMSIAVALLSLCAGGQAETLSDAWAEALESHAQVAAAAARRDAANYELERANAARLPSLALTSAYTRFDTAPGFAIGGLSSGPIFDDDDFLSAGAELRLPLYTGGSISAGIDAAESGAKAANSRLHALIRDIKLGVAEHYVAVLRAESAVDVATLNVASLRAHMVDTRSRLEFGAVPQNEFLAANVSLASAQQRLLQAENRLDYARAAYNRFVGRPLDRPVALDPALDIDALVPTKQGLVALIELAQTHRQELAAMQLHATALRRQSAAARAAARPQLSLTGGYLLLENEFLSDDRFWMAGLNVQWNVFDGGRSRKRSAALEREARAVAHDRADLESLIALEVRRAWNDRHEAESRLAVAESAVAQASENLRVVRNRYGAGASTNVEVLDAAALREQSLSNRDDARFEVALAKLRLMHATGSL